MHDMCERVRACARGTTPPPPLPLMNWPICMKLGTKFSSIFSTFSDFIMAVLHAF
jgi:hypothetical protein